MSKNLELSLVMRLRDLASSGFTRAQREIQSSIGQTDKATANLTRTIGNLGKQRSAADVLGIRTEQNIQREIQRTEAAYNRLQKSGTLSMREQARAADATRSKIRELNNEMGKYTLAQRAANGMRAGAAIAGGVAAGGYVLSKPIGQTMDYGLRLAQMSNTAFTERDTLGRIAGKRELNTAIVSSVRSGGGTRESAAETLDSIIASGAMPGKDAMSILPTIMKASTASGANATELAQIGVRAMQTFKIKAGELPTIMDLGLAAGQAGGFELKDMSKWLPQQMAMATNLGMSGKAGFSKLAAWNQASVITSGTKDEAGNNLRDLLMEVNTPHFARNLQKVGVQHADRFFQQAQANGVNKVDATIDMVQQIIGKDKNYQSLQTKLKSAKGEEKKQIIEAMAAQMEGTAVGKIFHNQQSLMALLGLMHNKEYVADVENKMKTGEGNAVDRNFANISSEAGFKTQQAANEKIFATQTAFENLTPLVGAVADGFTTMGRDFPIFTASLIAATTGLTALAAAALGMAGLTTLMGGKDGGGKLASILTKAKGAPGALGRGALALGSTLLTGSTAAVGASGAVGYGAGTLVYNGAIRGTELDDRIGGTIATIMAAFGDAEAKRSIEVNLHLDGEQISTVVNRRNARTASRN